MKGTLLLAGLVLCALAAGLWLSVGRPAEAPAAAIEAPSAPSASVPVEKAPAAQPAERVGPSPFRPAPAAIASRAQAPAAVRMPADAPREITGPAPVVTAAFKGATGPLTPEQMREADQARRAARRAAGYAKPDMPDEFDRYHEGIRRALDDVSDGPLPNFRQAALRALELDAPVAFGKSNGSVLWTERGPGNVSGRTRAIVVDPADPSASTWLVGGVGGGVWRTADAGLTWTDLTPDLPNLAVTALAQGVSNANVVYAGTGEGFFNTGGITGDGIWKSMDRGATWALLPSTNRFNGFGAVNRLIVDPADHNVVLAATNVGVYRSVNGGGAWAKVYESLNAGTARRVQQIVAEPGNFQIQYAAVNGLGVARSADGGQTWSVANLGGVRFELAVSPSSPATVYASAEVSTALSELYVSHDRGATWGVTTQASPINWLGGQGWYDNTIAVHPTDPSTVLVGGVDVFRINASLTPSSTRADVTSVTSPSWLSPVNFSGSVKLGLAYGSAVHGVNDVTSADFADVEVRFGPGRAQMAHRFLPGSGPFTTVPYASYTSVPFEVWDVSNPGAPRQLAASFFDQDSNGAFNLSPSNAEYIFVHSLTYDPAAATPALAVTGGATKKNPYFLWYRLPTGATWDPATIPMSAIVIDVTTIATYARTTTKLTHWYAGFPRTGGGVYPYLHADQHHLTFVPREGGFRLVNGNDGGANYSDDFGNTWTLTLNGYNSSQFYGADKRTGADEYIGGMQDNGTWRSPGGVASGAGTDWLNQIGGDGFASVWHAEKPNLLLGSVQFNAVYRSTDGGATYNPATNGLTDTGSGTGGYFVVAVAKSASDPDLLLTTGNTGPFRSDNFAASWKKSTLTVPTSWRPNAGRAPAAISTADPRVMWAGPAVVSSNVAANVQRIQVSTDGGLTFNPSSYITGVNAFVSGLAAHPTNRKKAYAAFSVSDQPKLYETSNTGASWTNISGTHTVAGQALSSNGFPNVATYSALVMPFDTLQIWAGTEIGLVVSSDGGATWGRPAFNFPAVSIWQMSIVDDQVIVATHGRGVWTATLSDLAGYAAPIAVRSPRIDALAQRPSGNIGLRFTRRSAYDSLVVFRGGVRQVNLGSNAAPGGVEEALVPAMGTGTVTYALRAYAGGQTYLSATESISVAAASPPVVTFASALDAPGDANAFAATGFSLATPAGFSNSAFHSSRTSSSRYGNGQTYTLQLRTPIIVAQTGATIAYDDIALVEPETNPNAFYDYVLVEATKDGSNWITLGAPYDARYDAAWLSRFNSSIDAGGNSLATGDPSLYRTHTVELGPNVQNTSAGRAGGVAGKTAAGPFAVGDTVYVRFRMVTDGSSTGWGWAIDNVKVQENGVLPVELAAFEGTWDAGKVRLRWSTASETNNAGFAVERALGDDPAWNVIGDPIPGAGTTSEARAYAFEDAAVPFDALKARYRLRQTDFDGAVSYSAVVEMAVGVPARFAAHDHFPNPVRNTTRIRYELPAASHVRVSVYDIAGRLVARPVDEAREAGRHEVVFDASNLASGLYLYRVEAGANAATKRMTVVR